MAEEFNRKYNNEWIKIDSSGVRLKTRWNDYILLNNVQNIELFLNYRNNSIVNIECIMNNNSKCSIIFKHYYEWGGEENAKRKTRKFYKDLMAILNANGFFGLVEPFTDYNMITEDTPVDFFDSISPCSDRSMIPEDTHMEVTDFLYPLDPGAGQFLN